MKGKGEMLTHGNNQVRVLAEVATGASVAVLVVERSPGGDRN